MPQGSPEVTGFAMEALTHDHQIILIVIVAGSLIVGFPLAVNTLWHLKVRLYCIILGLIHVSCLQSVPSASGLGVGLT